MDYVADGEGNKGERDRSDEVGRAVFLQQLLVHLFHQGYHCNNILSCSIHTSSGGIRKLLSIRHFNWFCFLFLHDGSIVNNTANKDFSEGYK